MSDPSIVNIAIDHDSSITESIKLLDVDQQGNIGVRIIRSPGSPSETIRNGIVS